MLFLFGCNTNLTYNENKQTPTYPPKNNLTYSKNKLTPTRKPDNNLNGRDLSTSVNLSNKDNSQKKIKLSWGLTSYNKKIQSNDDYEYPFTDIKLVISGEMNQVINIGSYMGGAWEIAPQDNKDRRFPNNSLLGCKTWFAGGGDDLCITRKSVDKLSVMYRQTSESTQDEYYELPVFTEIKTINIPKDCLIEPVIKKE